MTDSHPDTTFSHIRFINCLKSVELDPDGKNGISTCVAQLIMALFGFINIIPTSILIKRYITNKGGFRKTMNNFNIIVMSTIVFLNLFIWVHFFFAFPQTSIIRQI